MILEWTAKVTLILAAAALGSLLLRRSSAAFRHLVQVLGLIAALLLPLAAVALPSWEMAVLVADATSPRSEVAGPGQGGSGPNDPTPGTAESRTERAPLPQRRPLPRSDDCDCAAGETRQLAPSHRTDAGALLAVAENRRGEPGRSGNPAGAGTDGYFRWFAAAWLLGCALVLGRLGLGWLRMTRTAIDAAPLTCERSRSLLESCTRRLGLRRAPRVLLSRSVRVPVLWGFHRPTLLLPTGAAEWPAARLRITLLHELAHLRRLDGLALLVGRLAAAVWWFNPLVWLVERGARQECETACDDAVLACGERPSTYAVQLLRIAGELPAPLPAPAGVLAVVGRGALSARVRSILKPDVRRGLGRPAAFAVLALMWLGLVSVASAELVERDADSAPAPHLEPIQWVAALAAHAQDVRNPGQRVAVEPAVEVRSRVRPQQHARFELQPAPVGSAGDHAVRERVRDEIMLAHDSSQHGAGERAFDRAWESHRAEEWEQASAYFLEAAEAGFRPGTSLYNAACGQARLGRVDAAVPLIERSILAGFDAWKLLGEDADLDPIRREPAFRAMMETLQQDGRLGRRHADRFESVVDRFEDLRSTGSDDGEAWYEVGSALLSLREHERSVEALDRAAELLGSGSGNALYNNACAHALQGDASAALDYLERAVLAGFDSEERFRNDSDLDGIRDTRRFDEIERLHDELSLDRFDSDGGRARYSARRWEPAVQAYTAFTREHPDVGRGWHNLAWTLHFSRRHAEARAAFEKQLELGYLPDNAVYNIACTYAMEDNVDAALDWLGRAVDGKQIGFQQILNDDDLENLHDDPRFEQLLERAAAHGGLRERWHHRDFMRGWRERFDSRDDDVDSDEESRDDATLY